MKKTAPFSVVLGSHKTDEDPQYNELEEMPNHLKLVDQADTAILWNGHIWHTAMHNMYEIDSLPLYRQLLGLERISERR